MKIGLILILFITFTSKIHAFGTANELLIACESDFEKGEIQSLQKIQCLAYINGMVDGMQLVFGVRPKATLFCPPKEGMSNNQQMLIVKKWLDENPSKLHESARVSVLIAFTKAFPCTK